ncbi:MAG: DMT family transporter [Chitinivibrionales bacterium]|nr:DMT family transporter [Chitinivibrionales bacterium]
MIARLTALLSAILFAAAAPLSKILLDTVSPLMLAGFLYLGSGVSLSIALICRNLTAKIRHTTSMHSGLQGTDWVWLAAAIIGGGCCAPIVLMYSLQKTAAATASILLNFEAASTALIAALFFREHIGKTIWIALGLITVGSIILSINFSQQWGLSLGALGILAACLFWGIDNNCTRKIAGADPVLIVVVKGLVAGSMTVTIALIAGDTLPRVGIMLKVFLLGSLCYGMSLLLFIKALRDLGAGRTGAFFATAPFLGAGLSLLILHESMTLQFMLSVPCMVIGAILLLWENHSHLHEHASLTHTHEHRHDNDPHHHHDHGQKESSEPDAKHSHPHTHAPLWHEHAHSPDLHHRHDHDS